MGVITGPISPESKPLGHKAYGSIPHLPGSKRGPGDHGLEERQAAILTTTAGKGWTIVVQEKLDGSCMSVAKINGEIVALGRAGFRAESSPYEHLRLFAPWVAERRDRFDVLLSEGERVVGEWLLLATSLRYWIEHPSSLFVPFDLMRGHERATPPIVRDRLLDVGMACVPTLHEGPPIEPRAAFFAACEHRAFDVDDGPEGVVYRAIKGGRVSFLGKWTRSDFEPGRFLDGDPVWNYPPRLLRKEAA